MTLKQKRHLFELHIFTASLKTLYLSLFSSTKYLLLESQKWDGITQDVQFENLSRKCLLFFLFILSEFWELCYSISKLASICYNLQISIFCILLWEKPIPSRHRHIKTNTLSFTVLDNREETKFYFKNILNQNFNENFH